MSTPHGTFGQLLLGDFVFFSLEEEDKGNARSVSRIPAGRYTVKRTVYHRHGYPTYEITGVPGRSRILFHPGNTEEDTQGCVLLGMTVGAIVVDRDEETGLRNTKLAVLKSRQAFEKFMRLMGGVQETEIEITDPQEG